MSDHTTNELRAVASTSLVLIPNPRLTNMKPAPLPKGQSQLEVKATLRTRSLPNDEVKVTFDVEANAAAFRRYTDWASFILNQHVSGGPSALRWKRCEDVMPDSDETVMVHHPGEDEPVWLGYHDGEVWRYVDGAQCGVTHWMELPAPPRNENKAISKPHEFPPQK